MPEFISAALAAKTIGGAWFVKEIFAFFLKLRKQDAAQTARYRPEKEWEQYCIEKFESISEKVNQIFTTQQVLEVRIAHLESQLKRTIGGRK